MPLHKTTLEYESRMVNPLRYPFKSCSGFTLIEVLVSMAVIAIALLAVNKVYSRTITMANSVKFYTKASLLAQGKMVEIGSASLSDLMDDQGDFGENYPGYGWRLTVEDVESDLAEKVEMVLKRVEVTVFYNTDEFEFSTRQYFFTPKAAF